jgi:ATP-dependent DNA helicase RecG
MVATYCMLRAVEQGGQALLMAPTEVLADQHASRVARQLQPLGVEVGLLKGSQARKIRGRTLEDVRIGKVALVVGTHALIQEGVRFQDLRMAIVDEQHRFGVRQRDAVVVRDDGDTYPHVLHMSATPIPRTLSLTLYGDLEVSVLNEMPAGRRPVRTRMVFKENERRMWELVRDEIDRGRQAYVVCPLIEESEALQAASAKQTYDVLACNELSRHRVGLMHGQLASAEKGQVMSAFESGEIDVLVSTSVIEVGVDVPNATVMVIAGARRFGLSQLHQLRGRVGRGGEDSYCFLLASDVDETALERLALVARTDDGFALAEADLLFRGEGQLFGERQSGIGDLQVASLLRDRLLLEQARSCAEEILEDQPDPTSRLLMEAAEERFASRLSWLGRL